jgi:hypothetical protein
MDEQTEAEKQTAKWDEWYRLQITQVWEDIQSGTDSFDNNMLALSSGALGVSLAFIKDIVPMGKAVCLTLLMASWIAFAVCIVITIVSFQVSIAALKEHRGFLNKVFASRTHEVFNHKTFLRKVLTGCTYAAGFFFIAGLSCTMVFVIKNVENVNMTHDTEPIKQAVVAGDVDSLNKGRQPMEMLPIPVPPTRVTTTSPPVQTVTQPTRGETAPAVPCQSTATKE